MSTTDAGRVTRTRGTKPALSRRPWLEHWLTTVSDLSALKAAHPMMDAVIDEIDGRMIRVGDQWLADFASCNYLGFDLDPRDHRTRPGLPGAVGHASELVAAARQPRAVRGDRGAPHRAPRAPRTRSCFPTITHIHMSVIPLLAASGTIFLDARAHKTIYDGCQIAKARGAAVRRFRFEDPGSPRFAALPGARPHPPRVHGRRQQHDRQRAGPCGVRGGGAPPRRAALRRRRSRLRRDRRARGRRTVPLRRTREQHRALRRRELRQRRARRWLLEGLLVAARVHRLPDAT